MVSELTSPSFFALLLHRVCSESAVLFSLINCRDFWHDTHTQVRGAMLPATRDIWQGHPSTQAWKVDQQLPDLTTDLHQAAWAGDIDRINVSVVVYCNTRLAPCQMRQKLEACCCRHRYCKVVMLTHRTEQEGPPCITQQQVSIPVA